MLNHVCSSHSLFLSLFLSILALHIFIPCHEKHKWLRRIVNVHAISKFHWVTADLFLFFWFRFVLVLVLFLQVYVCVHRRLLYRILLPLVVKRFVNRFYLNAYIICRNLVRGTTDRQNVKLHSNQIDGTLKYAQYAILFAYHLHMKTLFSIEYISKVYN